MIKNLCLFFAFYRTRESTLQTQRILERIKDFSSTFQCTYNVCCQYESKGGFDLLKNEKHDITTLVVHCLICKTVLGTRPQHNFLSHVQVV